MKKRVVMLALGILISCCLVLVQGAAAFAQETRSKNGTNEVFELGKVVVTGKKAKVIGATTTITAKEIKAAGYQTLDEALTMVPGLHIRTAGRGIPRVDCRGLRTRQLIVLLNGVPIASPWNNQFDPSFIPVENISRIKVTRGPTSVLYGSGGNGGIINIITKKAQTGIHGSVNTEAGERDEYMGSATISRGEEKFNFFGSGSYLDRDDYPLPESFDSTQLESGDVRTNSEREQSDVLTNFMYTPSRDTTMALTLDYKGTDYGIPPRTVSDKFTNKKPKKLKKLHYRSIEDKNRYSGRLAFSHNFQNPLSFRGWTYVSGMDVTEKEYKSIDFQDVTTSTDRETQSLGVNLQPSWDMKKFGQVTLGLQGKRADVDSTVEDKNKGTFRIKEHILNYSCALEYRVNPLKPMNIVLGTGWHRQERSEGNDESDYSWLISSSYDFPSHTKLKASVARKIRFPALRRLYEYKKGNAQLNAENTRHYQVGVEQWLPEFDTTLKLDVYRIEAEDFVEKNNARTRYVNKDEYRFQGVETSVVNRSIKNLVLRGSYTYLDSENQSPNASVETLQYRPKHKVTMQGTYSFLQHYKFHLDYLWVGESKYLGKTTPIQTGTLDDHQVVDVKLSGNFLDKSTQVYIGARNLFDEEYAESYSLVMPGRRIYAGVEYSF